MEIIFRSEQLHTQQTCCFIWPIKCFSNVRNRPSERKKSLTDSQCCSCLDIAYLYKNITVVKESPYPYIVNHEAKTNFKVRISKSTEANVY